MGPKYKLSSFCIVSPCTQFYLLKYSNGKLHGAEIVLLVQECAQAGFTHAGSAQLSALMTTVPD